MSKLPETIDCIKCGGEGHLFCHDPITDGYSVDCEDCSNRTDILPTEAEAIARWNYENEPLKAALNLNVRPSDKSAWVRAAQASPATAGPGLANWVIEKLNDAALIALNAGKILIVESNHVTTWEAFEADNSEMDPAELKAIKLYLETTGEVRVGGGAHAAFTLRRI